MDALSNEQNEVIRGVVHSIEDILKDIKKFRDTYHKKFNSATSEDVHKHIYEYFIQQSKDKPEEIPKENLLKVLFSHIDDLTGWKEMIEESLRYDIHEV
jgi:uncharacterized FlaG/YvyC family protein